MNTENDQLRVLILLADIGTGGGGVSEVARLYAQEWKKSENLILEVVALNSEDIEDAKMRWPDVSIKTFRSIGPRRFGASWGMFWYLMRHDYDVAHVHGIWMFHVFAALVWSKRFGRPYIVTPHGMLDPWILNRSKLLKWAVSLLFQMRFLRKARFIHALNQKESDDILTFVGPCDIVIAPNFVPHVDVPEGRPNWWQDRFENRKILLFLGRIHDKKGWRVLLAAWEMACLRDFGFAQKHQLVFCGWIDAADGFQSEMERLSTLFGNVLLAGTQRGSEKFRSYAAADMFILPSKSEGLPMTVLEAWSIDCAVMMTRACNLPIGFELEAAIEIPEDADGIFAELIAWQSKDDVMIQVMRANGRKVHAKYYGPNNAASLAIELRRISRG